MLRSGKCSTQSGEIKVAHCWYVHDIRKHITKIYEMNLFNHPFTVFKNDLTIYQP